MKKFKYNSYLFVHQNNKNTPSIMKPNITLTPTFFKNSVKVYNGLNFFTIEDIQKKHLRYKIGTFINTRSIKKH